MINYFEIWEGNDAFQKEWEAFFNSPAGSTGLLVLVQKSMAARVIKGDANTQDISSANAIQHGVCCGYNEALLNVQGLKYSHILAQKQVRDKVKDAPRPFERESLLPEGMRPKKPKTNKKSK